jgi:hypothetical protein
MFARGANDYSQIVRMSASEPIVEHDWKEDYHRFLYDHGSRVFIDAGGVFRVVKDEPVPEWWEEYLPGMANPPLGAFATVSGANTGPGFMYNITPGDPPEVVSAKSQEIQDAGIHIMPDPTKRPFPLGCVNRKMKSTLWYHGSLVELKGRRRWKCAYCEFSPEQDMA